MRALAIGVPRAFSDGRDPVSLCLVERPELQGTRVRVSYQWEQDVDVVQFFDDFDRRAWMPEHLPGAYMLSVMLDATRGYASDQFRPQPVTT